MNDFNNNDSIEDNSQRAEPVRETVTSNTSEYRVVRNEVNKEKAVIRYYHVIWLIVGVIEVLLGFRFVFELLGANPYNGFTQLVYTVSYPFAQPFRSIFSITNIASATFDWSLLVAAVVYLFIGYGLNQLLRIILPADPQTSSHSVRLSQ